MPWEGCFAALAMTLVLPGLAAWANKVNFSDLDAKCVENLEKCKKCYKTLLAILTPIVKPGLRIVQANLHFIWQTQLSDDD